MPKRFSIFFLLSAASLICTDIAFAQPTKPLTTGAITYTDQSLEELLPKGTSIEIIGSGFQHIEGPVWIQDSNMLLFSDTKAGIIYRWQEGKGATKFLQNTGFTGRLPYGDEAGSNGLAIDKNNDLIICEHGDRKLALFPLNGKYGLKTITDNYEGKRYNSPNDVVIKSDGSIYYSDPPYGLPGKQTDITKETRQNGVYYVMKNGSIKLLVDSLLFPNGLAFSPDEKKFYVAVSDSLHPHILVYDVKSDGSLANGKLFFDASLLPREDNKQTTDGLKTDSAGNVWSSGPGGLLVINKNGKLLGSIHTGEIIANCAWGNNGSWLYITANTFLYRIKTLAKGANY